jgi:hypothetical protein
MLFMVTEGLIKEKAFERDSDDGGGGDDVYVHVSRLGLSYR